MKKNTLLLSLLTIACLSTSASKASASQSIAVPGYCYPGASCDWWATQRASSPTTGFTVMNPNSGVFSAADANYSNLLNTNNAAGLRTLGYVHTCYNGAVFAAQVWTDGCPRPGAFNTIKNNIDLYYQYYPGIKGIFLDESEGIYSGTSKLCETAYLYNYAKYKDPNATVVLNPGTSINTGYEPYGDVFLIFEDTESNYATWSPTVFESNTANSNRFWHIIHTVNSSNLASILTQSRAKNAGWVYVTTDGADGNPYDNIPTFWSGEVANVGALTRSTIPNRGRTALPTGCLDLTKTDNNTSNTTGGAQSKVTLNNTSAKPTIPTQFANYILPTGVSFTSASGVGWSCSAAGQSLSCTNSQIIAASSTSSELTVDLGVGCLYNLSPIYYTVGGGGYSLAPAGLSSSFVAQKPTSCTATTTVTQPTTTSVANTPASVVAVAVVPKTTLPVDPKTPSPKTTTAISPAVTTIVPASPSSGQSEQQSTTNDLQKPTQPKIKTSFSKTIVISIVLGLLISPALIIFIKKRKLLVPKI
jgi:hypothetical protein